MVFHLFMILWVWASSADLWGLLLVFWGLTWNSCALSTCGLSPSGRPVQASPPGRLGAPSSKRGQAQCAGTFQAPACIIFADEPLARVSHMTKPRFRGFRHKLPPLMGGAGKCCGLFSPVYSDRCEFLVTLGRRSCLILWINCVTLNGARKNGRSQWSNLNYEDPDNCGEVVSVLLQMKAKDSSGKHSATCIQDIRLKQLLQTLIHPVQNSELSSRSQSSLVWFAAVNTSSCVTHLRLDQWVVSVAAVNWCLTVPSTWYPWTIWSPQSPYKVLSLSQFYRWANWGSDRKWLAQGHLFSDRTRNF